MEMPMRGSMCIRLGKLTVVAAALACALTLQVPAQAETLYNYDFECGGVFSCTINLTANYALNYSPDILSPLSPDITDFVATHLFDSLPQSPLDDEGQILAVQFISSDQVNIITPGNNGINEVTIIVLSADGGTYTGTPIPSPELPTGVLTITGVMLGLLMRKRIAHQYKDFAS